MELYRGKTKDEGLWMVGSAICIGDKVYMLMSSFLMAERPAYNGMAMGCGLEDRGLTGDAYQAMEYGWEEAMERYEENLPVWEELDPETVTRCCGKRDCKGNVLFEGDIVQDVDDKLYEICYGKYRLHDHTEKIWPENVGFFITQMIEENPKVVLPLSNTEEWAVCIGNIFDDCYPREVLAYADQDAAQSGIMPAT